MGTENLSLHVLQHALGQDQYGMHEVPPYRNHFVCGEDAGGDWDRCTAHVAAGRMKRHGPSDLYGGKDSYCFVVTEAGKAFVRAESPKPPKLTRSQKRYRDYLRSATDWTFGEWLKYRSRGTV